MTTFVWGAATDTGVVRKGNEDSFLAINGLYAVADGMGGHQAGEVASRAALDAFRDVYESAARPSIAALVTAVENANRAVVEQARGNENLAGMGTTLVGMAAIPTRNGYSLGVVNIGDSRLYLFSNGDLSQITEDHSLVAAMERQGQITAEEAALHPQRNILTRALGIDTSVLVDSWEITPIMGDRFLLCSDGLFNELADTQIASVLRRIADPSEACRELIRMANQAGGRDNITCVIIDIVDDSSKEQTTAARVQSATIHSDATVQTARQPVETRRLGTLREVFTWRVVLFLSTVAFIFIFAFGVVWWTGTQTWFVGVDGENLAIYRGKPNGVLWFDPQLSEVTDVKLSDVPESAFADVQAGVEEGSEQSARRYIDNLVAQKTRETATTTTTTSSTTTSTTTTIAAVP